MAGFLFIMKKVKNVACYYNQHKRIRESLLMKCESITGTLGKL
ncbi:hypothetical protein Niako_2902 [Niastella koreensis GR20-10]|uniref:Uncharacterized protein n=1 Tax=Niastella koreensis (strain DSM 17620 / KACC 11465 / NBRC 106392 / GR20-10) TaxID=700598 RepID=G8TAQ5_NIAKG|nr:hypothetical protein Niako_2902 [Niastella koreensis GR20-10]